MMVGSCKMRLFSCRNFLERALIKLLTYGRCGQNRGEMSVSASLPFTSYARLLESRLGGKVWKLPIDIGASCPVRDGALGTGGCAFCNGRSFSPSLSNEGVREQLKQGKDRINRKLSAKGRNLFLAYFQNGTNTYLPVEIVAERVKDVLIEEGVCGVVFSTRPDCLTNEWLSYLTELNKITDVTVELGVESVSEVALTNCNRRHNVECSRNAIMNLKRLHIPVVAHFILGLPGDSLESMMAQTAFLNQLPVQAIKLHQLQIVKSSRFAVEYEKDPKMFNLWQADDYVAFVARYLSFLSPEIAIERFVSESPANQLIAPKWGLKGEAFFRRLIDYMNVQRLSQGCMLRT